MNLAPLKYLLFIENVTTIFRNYLLLKKRRSRIFVVCWVTFAVLNLIFNAVDRFRQMTDVKIHAHHLYFFSSISYSVYIMIASLYYSQSFYRLLLNFDAFHKIFDDEVYNQRMLRTQKGYTFIVVSFCAFKMFAFLYVRVYHSDKNINIILFVLNQYNINMCDFRYVFEYFVLRSIFFVLSEQLKTIKRSIDDELAAIIESRRNMGHADFSRIAINHEKLDKWTKAYENINDSCNLCNSMFSVQLTLMLLIVIAYYIMVMYTIVIITVQGAETFSMLIMNLLSMIVFLIALFVISRGGQNIQNNAMLLQQKICEFGLHTVENEDYYKLTKDLLRYVRTRPVRVHVFGRLNVNMSMLPSVVAFFTTNSVIALQFNNVL